MSSNNRRFDRGNMSVGKCDLISASDSAAIVKHCKEIRLLIKRQHITQNELSEITSWILKIINGVEQSVLRDVLNIIYCILKHSKALTSQLETAVVGAQGLIWKLLNEDKSSEINSECFKCVYAIITRDTKTVSTPELQDRCIKLCIRYLFKKHDKQSDELQFNEIALYALRILLHIYLNDSDADCYLNENIGVCKYWMLCGFNDGSDGPEKVAPSQQTVAEIPYQPNKKGGKCIKLRKPRNVKPVMIKEGDSQENLSHKSEYTPVNLSEDLNTIQLAPITSESDISDSESNVRSQITTIQAKIRLTSLNLLSVLIKSAEKHVIFGYWWSLLPDVKSNDKYICGGLGTVIMREPTVAGRLAALTALLALITASRSYLLQADSTKHASLSFTPFSVALGITIESIHKLIYEQFQTNPPVNVCVILLKCTAAIVQATPYHKMGSHLIVPIVENVEKYVTHRDWTVQVAALIVMGCIIGINPPLDGFLEIDSNDDKPCWIVKICLQNLGCVFDDAVICPTISTRLESLQVLSVIALQYFDRLLSPYMAELTSVLSSSLEDSSVEICFHAAKCVSSIGDAMQKSVIDQNDVRADFVLFWMNMMEGSLTKLLQSEHNASARAIACDCIGSIGEKIFMKLEDRIKILSATLLLGSSSDDDVLVRATAVRALAICIMYQQWREDIFLVSDCCEMALRVMSQQSPAVQSKASWALANITDALILNLNNPENECIGDVLFARLLKASITASTENDKIKMSVMRALGNLTFLMSESFLNKEDNRQIALNAIDVLNRYVKNGRNMKVRWNACCALGKALKNTNLYTYLNQWQAVVLENLCELTMNCRNLKVCIHASAALCSLPSRLHYGDHFIPTWTSTLQSLSNAHHVEDHSEYRHKNNLIEQLCVTLSHLACLLTTKDLPDIYDSLSFNWEVSAQLLQQVAQRIEPQSDNCRSILNAAKHVTTQFTPNNDSDKQCVNMLQNMFILEY